MLFLVILSIYFRFQDDNYEAMTKLNPLIRPLLLVLFSFVIINISSAQLTCAPGQEPDGNGGCIPCTEGNYSQDGLGCVPCEQGTISGVQAATSCAECSPGRTSNLDNTECIPCAAGTFNEISGGVCLPCDAGFTSLEGATECFPAPLIPTLSQWGIIILGFILVIFGILFLMRVNLKQKIVSLFV
jgi:hypothetical protein